MNLLPCPFCGSGKITIGNVSNPERPNGFWFVGCDEDDCPIESFAQDFDKLNAVAKWNTRADSWQPVSEGLPTKNGFYLVTCHQTHNPKPYVDKLQYSVMAESFINSSFQVVDAWMELPKPYDCTR